MDESAQRMRRRQRHNAVAEHAKLVHPGGQPISHATKTGLSERLNEGRMKAVGALRVQPLPACRIAIKSSARLSDRIEEQVVAR